MALAKDLSGLPKAAPLSADPVPPDPVTWVLDPWIDAEVAAHHDEGVRPQAFADTDLRNSKAGGCARALGYYVAKVPPSDPFDIPGIIVTRNGTRQHDLIQDVLKDGGLWAVEVPVRLGTTTSGSADGQLGEDPGQRVCWEHKNVGGYSYKKAMGIPPASRVPQGPMHSHIVQGALNALGMDAGELVVTYATWEAISRSLAARHKISERNRVVAQWTFLRKDWEPLARAELARMERIVDLVVDGELPARVIPDPELPPGHRIEDPQSGAWMAHDQNGLAIEGGTTWQCSYCEYQQICALTTSGRIPMVEAHEAATRLHLRADTPGPDEPVPGGG